MNRLVSIDSNALNYDMPRRKRTRIRLLGYGVLNDKPYVKVYIKHGDLEWSKSYGYDPAHFPNPTWDQIKAWIGIQVKQLIKDKSTEMDYFSDLKDRVNQDYFID